MPLTHLCARRASLAAPDFVTPALRSHRASSFLRPVAGLPLTRGLFGNKRVNAHSLCLEPVISRALRYRTLKTKAKLLDKLRRRSKFDWDLSQRPYLTQRHIRWASHYYDRSSRAKWPPEAQDEPAGPSSAEPGLELSKREKKWKEHMEALRKRVEQDPYEAVFGKRFEPFWGPLVPSWMKSDWVVDKVNSDHSRDNRRSEQTNKAPITASTNVGDKSGNNSTASPSKTYAYASTTSWNSWTNTARRTEWDTTTGKTRRYEYDPITNRMIQVDAPSSNGKPIEVKNEAYAPDSEVTGEVPVRNSPANSDASRKQGNQDVDRVTAAEIRAAMGKNKTAKQSSTPSTAATTEHAVEQPDLTVSSIKQPPHQVPMTDSQQLQPSISRMTASHVESADIDVDDSAAHESTEPVTSASFVPKEWKSQADILQSDRIRRTTSNRSAMQPDFLGQSRTIETISPNTAEIPRKISTKDLAQQQNKLEEANVILKAEVEQQKSLMQAHERRYSAKVRSLRQELDTAYKQSSKHADAHLDRIRTLEADLSTVRKPTSKPLHGQNFASENVRGEGDVCLNAAKYSKTDKWYKQNRAADMENAKAATPHQSSAASNTVPAIKDQRLEKALSAHEQPETYVFEADSLESELSGQGQIPSRSRRNKELLNAAPDAHQETDRHYGFKKDNIAEEVSVVCLQPTGDATTVDSIKTISTLGADSRVRKPLDDIAQLSSIESTAASDSQDPIAYRYKRDNLDTDLATKPAKKLASEEYRFKAPEAELESLPNTVNSAGEQTFAEKVDTLKAAPKSPAVAPPQHDMHDGYTFESDALEVELSQGRRGVRQAPSDRDYKFKADGVADQLYQTSRSTREPSDRPYRYLSDSLGSEIAQQEAEIQQALADANTPSRQTPSASIMSNGSVTSAELPTVDWEEPPVYKVLAYDSGNDMMSTATTTSNFAPNEQPISITTALSKLYQPARFVPHFADLQKHGFQAIHGTNDLLVFKKVRTRPAKDSSASTSEPSIGLVDHGLIKPMENALAEEAAMFYDRAKAQEATERRDDPTSVANGHLMPKENAMAQEAANFYDRARTAINPIDLTSRRMEIRPSTGNFASPTGFVNYDPVFPPDESASLGGINGGTSTGTGDDGGSSTASHVKRTEPVFSGASRASWSSSAAAADSRHARREDRREGREERRRRRRHGAGAALRWTLSVGATSAALCYMIGMAAEASRQERRERQR